MSDNPPLKRQRTDAQETQPLLRSRFWLDDGNVILQAENTQFRVHRSLLSMHSNVFKDMFSMPQPTDNTTTLTVDGCPVIMLSDKASDLEHVLSILYENIRAHDMRNQMPLDILSAILRLGKKYEIDYLCEEGLKRLRADFPNTLEQWLASFDQESQIASPLQHHHIVLQLCHELSIPSCLPTIYLVLATAATLDHIMDLSVDYGGAVNPEIIKQAVRGRDKLIQAYHEVPQGWARDKLFLPSQKCTSKAFCALFKVLACQSLFQIVDGDINQLGPWGLEKPSLCEACLNSLVAAHKSAREDLWNRLPTFFGLSPWGESKDFDQYNSSDT